MSEYHQQLMTVEWFDRQYRDLKGRLFAVPNGARIGIGQAVKLKKTGMRKGVPDLLLIYTTPKYHGLAIEMKDLTGSVSIEQTDWLSYLATQGFKTCVCFGFEKAKTEIDNYLKGAV